MDEASRSGKRVAASAAQVTIPWAITGEALYQSGLSLNASLSLRQVLDTALAQALIFSPRAISGRIYLWDAEKLVFGGVIWAGNGGGHANVDPPPDEATYQAARQSRVFVKNRNSSPGVVVAWPVRFAGRVVGVLTLYYARPAGPDVDGTLVVQLLADQAGIAIENARRFEMVSRQAYTDALTGLPNRRAFDDRLESETRRSSRYQHPFTLMMLDLDGFKGVNDQFGHPAGDDVLQQVASLLRQSLRESDFFARYGGDEFALILPETDRETANAMATRLKDMFDISDFTFVGSGSRQITLSVGLAAFPEDAITAKGLVSAADRALYSMKSRSPQHGNPAVSAASERTTDDG